MPIEPQPKAIADTVLRLAALATLLFASYRIAQPFIALVAWSTILAVILYPLHRMLRARTGLGNAATATIIGLALVALLLVPSLIAVESTAVSAIHVLHGLKDGTLAMPPVPPRLAALPVVGGKFAEAWTLAETNLPAAIENYKPFLGEVVTWLGGFVGGLVSTVLTFVGALALAAVIVAYSEPAANFARDFLTRLMGSRDNGHRVASLSVATIRGVGTGIIGVAFIQALLMGIGFFAIGTPAAGLLALAVMLLGIVQVPAMLVGLPVIVFAFTTLSTTWAIVFTVWTIIAGMSDAVLKPLLLGRGLEVPMPVILIGVIGGLVVTGLVGMFIGPVVLAVAYLLMIDWVRPPAPLP